MFPNVLKVQSTNSTNNAPVVTPFGAGGMMMATSMADNSGILFSDSNPHHNSGGGAGGAGGDDDDDEHNAVLSLGTSFPSPELREVNWVPNNLVSACYGCRTSFNFYRGKHHCRRCGNIFCGACSNKKIAMPERNNFVPVRVCIDCYQKQSQRNQTPTSAGSAAASASASTGASAAAASAPSSAGSGSGATSPRSKFGSGGNSSVAGITGSATVSAGSQFDVKSHTAASGGGGDGLLKHLNASHYAPHTPTAAASASSSSAAASPRALSAGQQQQQLHTIKLFESLARVSSAEKVKLYIPDVVLHCGQRKELDLHSFPTEKKTAAGTAAAFAAAAKAAATAATAAAAAVQQIRNGNGSAGAAAATEPAPTHIHKHHHHHTAAAPQRAATTYAAGTGSAAAATASRSANTSSSSSSTSGSSGSGSNSGSSIGGGSTTHDSTVWYGTLLCSNYQLCFFPYHPSSTGGSPYLPGAASFTPAAAAASPAQTPNGTRKPDSAPAALPVRAADDSNIAARALQSPIAVPPPGYESSDDSSDDEGASGDSGGSGGSGSGPPTPHARSVRRSSGVVAGGLGSIIAPISVPLLSIKAVDELSYEAKDMGVLELTCQDFRTLRLCFLGLVKHQSYSGYRNALACVKFYQNLTDISSVFAFRHHTSTAPSAATTPTTSQSTAGAATATATAAAAAKPNAVGHSHASPYPHRDEFTADEIRRGWSVYDATAEYERLGLTLGKFKLITGLNRAYTFCPSYPHLFVVPKRITIEELHSIASFRSKKRIPAIIWKSAYSNAVLLRSAQPAVGLMGQRNDADEHYLQEVAALAGRGTLLIADARPLANAVAQKAQGFGYENSDHYPNGTTLIECGVEFMGIENIHVVRKSMRAVHKLCVAEQESNATASGSGSGGSGTDAAFSRAWFGALADTGHLQHVSSILAGAIAIVTRLTVQSIPVLVHCSDGWDRTAQLTSLTQLLGDPYYRTLRGFPILIEKEWMAFGFKWLDRCGHGGGGAGAPAGVAAKTDEVSPIFIQFLDAVWQVWKQFPTHFEFNELFLIHLADNVYSCRFGSFLYNTEHDRDAATVSERTIAVWTLFHAPHRIHLYRNPLYALHRYQPPAIPGTAAAAAAAAAATAAATPTVTAGTARRSSVPNLTATAAAVVAVSDAAAGTPRRLSKSNTQRERDKLSAALAAASNTLPDEKSISVSNAATGTNAATAPPSPTKARSSPHNPLTPTVAASGGGRVVPGDRTAGQMSGRVLEGGVLIPDIKRIRFWDHYYCRYSRLIQIPPAIPVPRSVTTLAAPAVNVRLPSLARQSDCPCANPSATCSCQWCVTRRWSGQGSLPMLYDRPNPEEHLMAHVIRLHSHVVRVHQHSRAQHETWTNAQRSSAYDLCRQIVQSTVVDAMQQRDADRLTQLERERIQLFERIRVLELRAGIPPTGDSALYLPLTLASNVTRAVSPAPISVSAVAAAAPIAALAIVVPDIEKAASPSPHRVSPGSASGTGTGTAPATPIVTAPPRSASATASTPPPASEKKAVAAEPRLSSLLAAPVVSRVHESGHPLALSGVDVKSTAAAAIAATAVAAQSQAPVLVAGDAGLNGRARNLSLESMSSTDSGPAAVIAPNVVLLPRSAWKPDDHFVACPACRRQFSLLRRRHHCRTCGGVFCGDCTQTHSFPRTQILDLSPTAMKKSASAGSGLNASAVAASQQLSGGGGSGLSVPDNTKKVLLCNPCGEKHAVKS